MQSTLTVTNSTFIDPDDLAFCPVCEMDRMPVGGCSQTRRS
jgi:hypothetical protein